MRKTRSKFPSINYGCPGYTEICFLIHLPIKFRHDILHTNILHYRHIENMVLSKWRFWPLSVVCHSNKFGQGMHRKTFIEVDPAASVKKLQQQTKSKIWEKATSSQTPLLVIMRVRCCNNHHQKLYITTGKPIKHAVRK